MIELGAGDTGEPSMVSRAQAFSRATRTSLVRIFGRREPRHERSVASRVARALYGEEWPGGRVDRGNARGYGADPKPPGGPRIGVASDGGHDERATGGRDRERHPHPGTAIGRGTPPRGGAGRGRCGGSAQAAPGEPEAARARGGGPRRRRDGHGRFASRVTGAPPAA